MVNNDSLHLAGITAESVVDGPGLRFVVFAQGCPHQCVGCHNPTTQPFEGGEMWEISTLLKQIQANPLLAGVTITGGEPFVQAVDFARLAALIKEMGLNVVTYTGYTYETLIDEVENEGWQLLLRNTDILIDGPFIEKLKDLNLPFRGSKNQRLIDVPKSLAQGQIVEVSLR